MTELRADDIPPDSALLLVDVQRGFMSEHTDWVPEALGRLLDEHGRRFRLVVASRFLNTDECPTRLLLDSHSLSSDEEVELCPPIPRSGLVVLDKSTYALGERLGALIHQHRIGQLFISGVDTHACVLHEALDAFDRCVRPVVLADLCASGDGEEAHAAALSVMRRAIGVHNVWGGDEDARRLGAGGAGG